MSTLCNLQNYNQKIRFFMIQNTIKYLIVSF